MGALALANLGSASFVDRGLDLLAKIEYRRAETEEEREEIFRLRYRCFLGEGAISPNPEERFTDRYDELGGTWLVGIYLDGRIVASMRICVATAEFPELPAMWAFKNEVQPLLDAGQVVIDPTRFTVDRNVSREHPLLAYMTARIGWLAGEYFQANTILATQRREHQAFYRRVFNYKLIAEPRHYPTLEKPLGLMTLDYFAERDRVNNRYPFFRSTALERRMMFERLQQAPGAERRPLRVVEPVALAPAGANDLVPLAG